MFSVTARIKWRRSQQQVSRSSSENLYDATDGECASAFVKDTSAEAGETSLWMIQSACRSAQHLLDPAGTRAVLEKGTRWGGSRFSSAPVTLREDPAELKTLQNFSSYCSVRSAEASNDSMGWWRTEPPSHSSHTAGYKCGLERWGEIHTSECVRRHWRSWGGLRVYEEFITLNNGK